jgi:hypothetical protein
MLSRLFVLDWIVKIIAGKTDEFVHAKLVKYGVGEHPGPRVKLSLSSSRIAFKGDLDTEKMFSRAYVLGATALRHRVSGTVICYSDRTAEFRKIALPLEWSKSKGQGATVYKAKLKETVPKEHLQQLFDTDGPSTFFLLSIEPADAEKPWKITTKTAFPKGPGSEPEEEGAQKDPVFTRGALGRTKEVEDFILSEVLPDVRDRITQSTKNVGIRHTLVIEDIEIPEDPCMSYQEKRRLAKKRGRLVRYVDIDGTESVSEYRFVS